MNQYKIEVTDTFAGDANYCWVRRYEVSAVSMKGAVRKLGLLEGSGWRLSYGDCYFSRYNLKGVPICAFIEEQAS